MSHNVVLLTTRNTAYVTHRTQCGIRLGNRWILSIMEAIQVGSRPSSGTHIYTHTHTRTYDIADTWPRSACLTCQYSILLIYLIASSTCTWRHVWFLWRKKFAQLNICIETSVFVYAALYIRLLMKCSTSSIASQKKKKNKFVTFWKLFVFERKTVRKTSSY